jgi:hypothetical protein
MDNLIVTINRFFIAVDERNWTEVERLLAPEVLLDYTSMAGGAPASLSPGQITGAWKNLLPGFDKTHHQLGNFLTDQTKDGATAFFYGTASHFLANPSGKNLWLVVGSYDVALIPANGLWQIKALKFNLKFIDGNTDLPVLAQERVKQSGG